MPGWLTEILNLLSKGWVGTTLGIVGMILAVYFYVATRQRTRLAYQQIGKRLLGLTTGGLPSGITVQYQGREIPPGSPARCSSCGTTANGRSAKLTSSLLAIMPTMRFGAKSTASSL